MVNQICHENTVFYILFARYYDKIYVKSDAISTNTLRKCRCTEAIRRFKLLVNCFFCCVIITYFCRGQLSSMRKMQDLLESHLQLLNTKLEESRKLMKDNIFLHEQLRDVQRENEQLRNKLKALQAKEVVDRHATNLSATQGNRQTKAWVDRLVQEIDACLESLNR